MKKFLIKILCLFFVLISLFVLADYIISWRYWSSRDYRFAVWNDIIEGGMDNDIIIMGSSRAWVQMSPFVIDSILGTKTYNLGIDGSTLERQIPRYNLYALYNKKPKIILYNVDWWATFEHGKEKNHYLVEQYLPYFYNGGMRNEVLPKEGLSKKDMYIPLLRYIRYWNLYDAMAGAVNEKWILDRGYKGLEQNWNDINLRNIDSLSFSYSEESKEYFCNYLKQCNDDDIKVVFVCAPFYIEGTKKVNNLNVFYEVIDSIARQYNVSVLDYFNSPICYDTAYFYNATHLNKKGSELFSSILANDLDSLGLLNSK